MLLALTTGQRAQTLHKVDIRNINFGSKEVYIPITALLKTSHPKRQNKVSLHLRAYQECPEVCVVQTLKEYLIRTEPLRGCNSQLLISFIKPHGPISNDTVSRWLKKVLFEAGVETELFTGHSTRAAKTSKEFFEGMPVEDIIRQAGWSNSRTFEKFYKKVIITERC